MELEEEKHKSSLGKQPSTEGTFLFVNESEPTFRFKQGHRHDVRSHIRRHVMKSYQKRQMRTQSSSRRQLQPLAIAPSHLTKNLSEKQHPSTSVAHSKLNSTISTVQQTTKRIPNPRRILDEEDDQDSEDSGSWPVISPGPPSPQKYVFNNKKSYSVHQSLPTLISRPPSSKKISMDITGSFSRARGSFKLSPLELMGSGRIDPFLTYPIAETNQSVHELMDHSKQNTNLFGSWSISQKLTAAVAITYLLPGLVPDAENSTVNSVSKAWFTTGLTYPLLFHALVFAGSIHLDFMRWNTIYPNSPTALSHKLMVIQQLNMILSNPKEAYKDEVILAILILASHEARDKSEDKARPFNSPLMAAQWLNVYGNIQYVPEHMKAVMDLIAARGGLENLKLHGLAETIVK